MKKIYIAPEITPIDNLFTTILANSIAGGDDGTAGEHAESKEIDKLGFFEEAFEDDVE